MNQGQTTTRASARLARPRWPGVPPSLALTSDPHRDYGAGDSVEEPARVERQPGVGRDDDEIVAAPRVGEGRRRGAPPPDRQMLWVKEAPSEFHGKWACEALIREN